MIVMTLRIIIMNKSKNNDNNGNDGNDNNNDE